MAKAKKEVKEEQLETQLWKAADKLRKNIDAAEYKHIRQIDVARVAHRAGKRMDAATQSGLCRTTLGHGDTRRGRHRTCGRHAARDLGVRAGAIAARHDRVRSAEIQGNNVRGDVSDRFTRCQRNGSKNWTTSAGLTFGHVHIHQRDIAGIAHGSGVIQHTSQTDGTQRAVLGRQGFAGIQLPVNVTVWPFAILVGTNTVNCPSFTKFVTVTLTKVLLPQLTTVPVNVIAPFSQMLPTHCAVI